MVLFSGGFSFFLFTYFLLILLLIKQIATENKNEIRRPHPPLLGRRRPRRACACTEPCTYS
jgi:hypothetical protein